MTITSRIKQLVTQNINKASEIYKKKFDKIEIRFDLKGKTAGQYCVDYYNSYFRFNLDIANKYNKEYDVTVIHEVAHYIQREMFPMSKPHGKEWKKIMNDLGVMNPKRTHSYEVEYANKMKTFIYKCDCRTHEISKIRHNRSIKGTVYKCSSCKSKIKYIG